MNLATVYPSGPITGGFIVGLVTLVVCLFIGVFMFFYGLANWSDRSYDQAIFRGTAIGGLVVAIASFGVWLFASWPLAYEYHHWVPVQGKVEQVSKRLKSCGDGCVEQRYVVIVHGKPYGIDDTRAALLHEGDSVSIRCKKEYEYGVSRGAHGWACKWAKSV